MTATQSTKTSGLHSMWSHSGYVCPKAVVGIASFAPVTKGNRRTDKAITRGSGAS